MFRLYDLFISLMTYGMWVLSPFNEKIRKGFKGRKESLHKVKNGFSKTDRVIWMHAASLGEYLQGLPVLEGLKNKYPDHKILITFFSPSGYENAVKRDKIADVICYLPFDKKKKVQRFCEAFQTVVFFTVKYDYWYRLFDFLNKRKVSIYVVSALFYKRQIFFKSYGKLFVKELERTVTMFFHQTQDSLKLAELLGLNQSVLSGDTRFDKVKQNVLNFKEIPMVRSFIGNQKTLVIGSSWEAEENIAVVFANQNPGIKIILAPHDLKRIPQIVKNFDHHLLYSELEAREDKQESGVKSQQPSPVIHREEQRGKESYPQSENRQPTTDNQILIIDNIGMLSKLYHYADAAMVGGGFHRAGLHNILEAAAFGIPVLMGDQYKKNPEADGLIKAGGAKKFSNPIDGVHFLNRLFSEDSLCAKMGKNSQKFIFNAPNAADIVLKNIKVLN